MPSNPNQTDGTEAPSVRAGRFTLEVAGRAETDVPTHEIDLAETITRPLSGEKGPASTPGVVVDRQRQVLVGARAVAQLAGQWIDLAAVTIRAVRDSILVPALPNQAVPFPTYPEACLAALDSLDR